MPRNKSHISLGKLLITKASSRKYSRPLRRLRLVELLEDRSVPAVTYSPDGTGRFVVQFTEDVPSTADTLLLRVNSGGLLEYSVNGGATSTDLKSSAPGIQALADRKSTR